MDNYSLAELRSQHARLDKEIAKICRDRQRQDEATALKRKKLKLKEEILRRERLIPAA